MRRNKYNNRKTSIDGYLFDSMKEAKRYRELCLLVKDKKIVNLKLQPEFEFKIREIKIFKYIADFQYSESVNKAFNTVIEDVKGMKTPIYRLKKKIIEAYHGVTIVEV